MSFVAAAALLFLSQLVYAVPSLNVHMTDGQVVPLQRSGTVFAGHVFFPEHGDDRRQFKYDAFGNWSVTYGCGPLAANGTSTLTMQCELGGLDNVVVPRFGCWYTHLDTSTGAAVLRELDAADWEAHCTPYLGTPLAPRVEYVYKMLQEHRRGFVAELNATTIPNRTSLGEPLRRVILEVTNVDTHTVRLRFTDPAKKRWEVPDVVHISPYAPEQPTYKVHLRNRPFSLEVYRSDSATSFPMFKLTRLFLADQYLEVGTGLPTSAHILGLGERITPFVYNRSFPTSYAFMASDQGTPAKKPLYGSHPFYMDVRPSDDMFAHGVFLLNSNAMATVLTSSSLVHRTTGGVIDLFFFTGPNPSEVLQQYHTLIGKPFLPPKWALGFHQCRWGYKDVAAVQAVVDQFATKSLPLDTVWVDIDYMDDFKVFTLDPTNFASLPGFVHSLHSKDMHFVPIVDPGVKIEANYSVYETGIRRDIFIKDPTGSAPVVGKVWPGLVYFPDWIHPNASEWWMENIRRFHDLVPIDGLWTDMNEVANFCDGRCKLDPFIPQPGQGLFECSCPHHIRFNTSFVDNPPFIPPDMQDRTCRSGLSSGIHGLDCGTLSMACKHFNGELEYNWHNLFGHYESKISAAALAAIRGKRPFVLTRSTAPSSGSHVAHWLGDNDATWQSMRDSIPGILSMNMFGVPLVGADICGFSGNSTAELCARWMQLGAFYPFSRNHNTHHTRSQEPYAFGQPTLDVSRRALSVRYQLIANLYTRFYLAHAHGGCVACGMYVASPGDPGATQWQSQYMLGPELLVAPVLYPNASVKTIYLPPSTWYNLYSGQVVAAVEDTDTGTTVDIAAPLVCPCSVKQPALPTSLGNFSSACECSGLPWSSSISPAAVFAGVTPILMRSGSIVVTQDTALTVPALQSKPYTMHVALPRALEDGQQAAAGWLYLDDGDSFGYEAGEFTLMRFIAFGSSVRQGFTLQSTFSKGNGYTPAGQYRLLAVRVMGSPCQRPAQVRMQVGRAAPRQIQQSAIYNVSGSMGGRYSVTIKLDNLVASSSFLLEYSCATPSPEPPQPSRSGGLDTASMVAIIVCCSLMGLILLFLVHRWVTRRRDANADYSDFTDTTLFLASMQDE